jgi:2-oxoglutarate ferredoxin oxidoreductase subunit alpha
MDARTLRRHSDEVRITIGGPAGFGIKAAGQTLSRTFMHAGLWTADLTEYPSLIKGGHNVYNVRVAPRRVHCPVQPIDLLVALDAATVAAHRDALVPGAAVVYDPADLEAEAIADRDDLCLIPIELTTIVRDAGGPRIMRNVAALGAVLGVLEFPLEPLERSLRAQFAHKAPEIAEMNVAVARAGYETAAAERCALPVALAPVEGTPERILVDGNEAIGTGAIAAGLGLYAAYPMTPASSLLSFMAAHDEEFGYVCKHTEDEIAAMNWVVGGAFTGTRSMCATSGGGFSLMVEALGLAGVSESAVVLGLFMRTGPATGQPTFTEQSDLRFALHAAQGEFPRVVLAPGDRTQAFEFAWRAFNLADQLQTPVIVLSDTFLSDNRCTIEPFATDTVTVERGRLIAEGDVADVPEALAEDGTYHRYRDQPDGVSLRALPGVRGATQVVNSYEHDEYGFGAAGEDAATRVEQNEKRLRKLDLARTLVPPTARYGANAAELGIVCFGSTVQPVREAIDWLAEDGVAVSCLQVTTLWPFPDEEVAVFLDTAPISLVIEGNATGQLEGLIRERTLRGPDERLRRYDGRPFMPEQIWEHVMTLTGREVRDDA